MTDLQMQMRTLYSDRLFQEEQLLCAGTDSGCVSCRALSREIGRRGQQYVQRFSPDAVARSYAERCVRPDRALIVCTAFFCFTSAVCVVLVRSTELLTFTRR